MISLYCSVRILIMIGILWIISGALHNQGARQSQANSQFSVCLFLSYKFHPPAENLATAVVQG